MKACSVEMEKEEQGKKAYSKLTNLTHKNENKGAGKPVSASQPSQQHSVVINIPLLGGFSHHIL